MLRIERGIPLVERCIGRLRGRAEPLGASPAALDALESRLMVELPPTLRHFLAFDFTFATFGKRWQGRHRFGKIPASPQPKLTSVRRLAEAMVEFGWTESRARARVVRLPNLPGHHFHALYLGEARRDGELPILGLEADDTHVRSFVKYTAFDLYLADQIGLYELSEGARLDDLESVLALNPELGSREEEEEVEEDY